MVETVVDVKPDVVQGVVPRHIGVILDGNRRFARKLTLQPWRGHEWGVKKVEDFLNWASEVGVKELTLYAFSLQNFSRPKKEFDYLMNLFLDSYKKFLSDDRIDKFGIHIKFIGRISLLPADLQDIIKDVEEKTKVNDNFFINIAMAYGGREEIVDAVKALALKVKSGELSPENIDESVFSDYLALQSEPDMIIRTGGDFRTSNFLIWQSNYSEWFFVEKSWPAFEKEDFLRCLDDFSKRKRRFGR